MANLTDEQKQALRVNLVDVPQPKEPEAPLTAAEQQAVAQAKADTAALMQMKAELIVTTSSRGWSYIQKFAETVVRNMEQEAIAEDDDAKANGLRRDARGARKFKDELLKRIAMATRQEPQTFMEVVTD